jgi:hypothetical protein
MKEQLEEVTHHQEMVEQAKLLVSLVQRKPLVRNQKVAPVLQIHQMLHLAHLQ